MKISLRRRHALTVADGAFSHKIDYVTIFKEILNPKGHPNCITVSKVTAVLLNGGFCPLVDHNREGSAPAACAADLFHFFCPIVCLPPKTSLSVVLEYTNIIIKYRFQTKLKTKTLFKRVYLKVLLHIEHLSNHWKSKLCIKSPSPYLLPPLAPPTIHHPKCNAQKAPLEKYTYSKHKQG